MLSYIRQRLVYFKTTIFYFGSTFFSAILGVVINPFLAKSLSPADYAAIGYFSSFQVLLLPFVGLNLNSYLLNRFHFIEEDRRDIFISSLYFSTATVGLFSVFVFSFVLYLYFDYKGVRIPYFPMALFAFFQTYFTALMGLYLATLRIKKLASRYALVVIANAVVNAVVVYLFVVDLRFGAEGRFASAMLTASLGVLWASSEILRRGACNFRYLKEGFKFGLPLTLSGVLWYFLVGLDKNLLLGLNNDYLYGNYVVASQVAAYFAIFYTSINNVFESDFYFYAGRKDYRRLLRVVFIVLSFVFFVNGVFFIFAKDVVAALTGGAYTNSYEFARVFAFQNFTMALYYLVVQLLIAFGLVKEELLVRVIGVCVTIPLLYYSVDKFGFWGGAWSQVVSFLVLATFGLIAIKARKIAFF